MKRLAATAATIVAGIAIIALTAAPTYAQGARSSMSGRSGGLRQSYQSGRSGSQLPLSSGGGMRTGGAASGGIGQRGGGGAASGQTGLSQGPMSAGLAQSANERFQEGGFVGRDADDVRASFDSQSGRRGGGRTLDTMIENLNEMRDSRRRWRERNSAPPPVHVRLQPAFDLPPVAPAHTAAGIQARLGRVMQAQGVASPQVEMAGRTVFLRGVAASAHDRALVGQLASFEPGVSQVENLVTIQPPPAR